MLIGDVGTGNWEEVELPEQIFSGRNLGWKIREGNTAPRPRPPARPTD